jgi:hypothetical protein
MRSGLVKPETLSMKHNKARNGDTVYPVRFAEVAVTGEYDGVCLSPKLTTCELLDSQNADMSEVNPHLGTIKITIQRVEEGWTKTKHERPTTPPRKRFIMDDSPVHESKKSLIGHRIKSGISYNWFQSLTHSGRLGHAMPSEKKDAYDIQVRDPDEIPYRTFIFYYRPTGLSHSIHFTLAEIRIFAAVLQALGHAPLSPPVSVKTTKRSWSTLSDSEQDAKPELDREEEEIQVRIAISTHLPFNDTPVDSIGRTEAEKGGNHGKAPGGQTTQERGV